MSQVATYRDKRQVVAKPYAPGGCPVHLGKQKCGETQGLDIIMDFHKLYQEKMSEIDVSAGGDSLQEKVNLQEQWINDLTEQNKLLAKVIEELESETIGRVQQLEDKLNNAVKSFGEDDMKALPEKEKIIEETEKNLVPLPAPTEELEKKNEENERLKQLEFQSEKEIKNHSMTEITSNLSNHEEVAPLEIPTEESIEPDRAESKDEKDDNVKEVLNPPVEPSIAPSSVAPSQKPSFQSDPPENEQPDLVKEKFTSRASSKSVHLILETGTDEAEIVEPEKDLSMSSDIPEPPPRESVPVMATQDSLVLLGKTPQSSEKHLPDEDKVCICGDKDYWDELESLKEENKMLREGGELERLKKEVEEKMERILELNEENRNLNEMINMLRANQKSGKKQKEPPSDSEPMSSDSDYCTGICEPPRTMVKTPTLKRRATCREKCGYQYRDLPDPTHISKKLCVCREDSEKGNESPPFIDVYKREDKGKFISDSSSTVCNEEVCPFLKIFQPYDNQHRARGGNDSSNPCPAGTFPNFQYTQVCDECNDRTCPLKDNQPITEAIDTDAVNCGVHEISLKCGNQSCQTEGCQSFQGDLGPPMTQCGAGSCLNTNCAEDEKLIGVDNFLNECSDRSCPNKDFYEPTSRLPLSPYAGQPSANQGQGGNKIEVSTNFPLTCTDETCQVLECSAKGNNVPQTQSYAPGNDFPITCDDATCHVPGCSARGGEMTPTQSSVVSQAYSSQAAPSGYPAPQVQNVSASTNPSVQSAFPPQGIQKAPSICICGVPDECQKEEPQGGKPIENQASSFANPPRRIADGRCSRGVCDYCACIPFPSPDGQPHATVPPPASQPGGGRGGRCARGLCDTCACIVFPGVVAGSVQRPIATLPTAPSYGGTKTAPGMEQEEFCALCGCQLTKSDIMKGKTCDAGVGGTSNFTTSHQVISPNVQTAMRVPVTTQPGDECICTEEEEIKVTATGTAVQEECICDDNEIPVASQKYQATATGPVRGDTVPLGPRTVDTCPDEICPAPCSCKVVPSEPYIDPDDPKPVPTRVSPAVGGEPCDPCDPCLCEGDDGTTGVGKSSARAVEPASGDLCPDEICQKPCTCKVVPSEEYIDSDTDVRRRQLPTGAAVSGNPPDVCSVICQAAIENPSYRVTDKASVACSAACSEAIGQMPGTTQNPTEVCSVVCQAAIENPSFQVNEKASVACSAACSEAINEKPSVRMAPPAVPSSAVSDGVCGDSTCARRYPKGGSAVSSSPSSKPRPPPPGGDDRSIIRCICKSKYCKVIPDPDNPNQKLCVDVSDTQVNRRSSCVCEPTCPDVNPNVGGCCDGPANDAKSTSQYPTRAPVMTVNQLYKMPKTPEGLSKEQEYAGLSRKDSVTRRFGYIPPRKAYSKYGIPDDDNETTGNEEMKNADLKLVIADLKSKLLDAEDKIEELKSGKNYSDKDNDTTLINKYAEEINEMKKSMKWTKKEREEYEHLKQKVKLLEQGRGDTDNITSNLQTAVDLYVDTIELLEASEQKLNSEIEQYKISNDVLHENILNMREDIENMKKHFQEELNDEKWIHFISLIENCDVQHANAIYLLQINKYQTLYQQMMELNYDLEMEHVNNLQDLSMMETQFNKYQSILKMQEEEKVVIRNQLKKLTKKNKCYEEVVQFFKDEMSVMSDELLTLQEVLNVTNVSSQEENNKLISAILQLRRINDRLVAHLCAIEKQAILENQINQINEARINELQNIISSKNNDLTQHDDIIQDMRRKLNNATRQNADLKKTIKNLTDTVVEIQEGIKSVEREQIKNLTDVSVVESKVCLASGDLESIKTCMEQKNSRIAELENQLKSQEVELILANKELGMLKEKKADSKELINSLKEQLSIAEKKNEQALGDYQMVVNKLRDYANLEHMKNYELNHYKSLVEEMKMSLVQLNNGLEKCEASNIHFYEDLRNSDHMRGRLQHRKNNLPIVFDELKKSMADLKRRLSEADFKGGLIEEELLKVKESHMSQIPEEVTDTQKELEAKIISSIEEQSRLNQLVEEQKEEIERLSRELEKERADLCCCKRSVSELKNEKSTSNAEIEISQLKCELNKSLHRQRMLNEENDQMHTQMINLRKKLTFLEQAYDVLKQENEEYKMQLKRTIREKEYLMHKNRDLTKTIEQMRSTHDQLEKQCRTMMKKMSEEKSWIKTPMQQPFSPRRYGTVAQLDRRTTSPTRTKKLERHTADARYRSSSPWREMNSHMNDEYLGEDTNSHRSNIVRNISYDSNSSPYTSRSPSPRSTSIQGEEDEELDEMNLTDWFSPNYRETETDADEGEEETFINKVHLMTAQVQEANKRWQKKMNKEHLSKSRASNK